MIVAPILDSLAVAELLREVQAGSVPAAVYLILHNQKELDTKLTKLLEDKQDHATTKSTKSRAGT